MQVNGLMEKSQKKYTHETNCTKNSNQQNCMLMKESLKRHVTQNIIRKKKKAYFEEKPKENTANPKKL